MPMLLTVAFCETGEHVREAGWAGTHVVAVTPEAAWECQCANVPYLRLEDHYSGADLLAGQVAMFREVTRWADWVDCFLQEHITAFANKEFAPAKSYFFALQCLFNEFYAGSYILDHFLEAVRPAAVLHAPWSVYAPDLSLRHREPIYGSLLPLIANRYGTRLLPSLATASNDAERYQTGKSNWRQWAARWRTELRPRISTRLWEEMRLVRKCGVLPWLASLATEGGLDYEALFVGSGYDLDLLAIPLRRRGVRVRWLSNIPPSLSVKAADRDGLAKLRQLWPIVTSQKAFWAPLAYLGIEPNPRAASSLSAWWYQAVPILWEAAVVADALLSKNKYSVVMAAAGGGQGLEGSILGAARHREVPSAAWQHGSTSRVLGWGHYDCFVNADFFFVYGEGSNACLRKSFDGGGHKGARIVPIGSPRFDGLRRRFANRRVGQKLRRTLAGSDKRPLVLYVPTAFGGYGRAVSDLAGYPDVSYFELQQRVIGIFSRFPSVRLVYKEFPSGSQFWSPMPTFIRDLLPDAVTTEVHRLTDLMCAVDAIIIDHAITALGEALLTHKPLVVYDEAQSASILEPPGARDLLAKRAILAGTPEEFEAVVERFLAKGDFAEIESPNNEFLLQFGTYRGDGESAERAANFICDLTGRPGDVIPSRPGRFDQMSSESMATSSAMSTGRKRESRGESSEGA